MVMEVVVMRCTNLKHALVRGLNTFVSDGSKLGDGFSRYYIDEFVIHKAARLWFSFCLALEEFRSFSSILPCLI